jgi:acetolactate synthase-1/2/3 large subunit
LAQHIRVSDYIAQTLVAHGVSDVFMLTGGGAMHLNDAFGRAEGLNYISCHHEQACAMAAEAYTRLSGKLVIGRAASMRSMASTAPIPTRSA